jgi:hypothetical protein
VKIPYSQVEIATGRHIMYENIDKEKERKKERKKDL